MPLASPFRNNWRFTPSELLVTLTTTVILLNLLVVSQERSINDYVTWLGRLLFALGVILENKALFSSDIARFLTLEIFFVIIACITASGIAWSFVPVLFLDCILLPFIFSALYFYYSIARRERLDHLYAVNPWVSIRTLMILFDCFSLLKFGTLLGLAVYHFLTNSTPVISELLSHTWTASTESLFPYTSPGNNQWALKILCSLAFVVWHKNKLLHIPIILSWLYLAVDQYQYIQSLPELGSMLDFFVPVAYPILILLWITIISTVYSPTPILLT